MLFWLILLFTVGPALEITILLLLGREIGVWPTLALILITGVLGGALAKLQGMRVARQIQADIAAGRVPTYGLIDSLLILVGGALLLTPGILTDVAGLLLLFPVTRDLLKRRIRVSIERYIQRRTTRFLRF